MKKAWKKMRLLQQKALKWTGLKRSLALSADLLTSYSRQRRMCQVHLSYRRRSAADRALRTKPQAMKHEAIEETSETATLTFTK